MKIEDLKKFEKICVIGIISFSLLLVGCLIIIFFNKGSYNNASKSNVVMLSENSYANVAKSNLEIKKEQNKDYSQEKPKSKLTQKLSVFPSRCRLYEQTPEISFTKEDGTKLNLKDLKGKVVIITFWASWCKNCVNELKHSQEFYDVLKKYENVEFILVNKLDGIKETKEQALNYLKSNNIQFSTVFDEDLAVYNKLGIKIIPTTLIIDKEGKLKNFNAGEIDDAGKLEALIQNTLKGNSYSLEQFVKNKLTNDDGGIMTSYLKEEGNGPTGTDVLSESQGIILEYAALKNDKELFQRTFEYIKKNMKDDELAAWRVSNGKSSRVNAVMDDLRIYKSMEEAPETFGNYTEELNQYRDNFYKYNVNMNNLIDNYDFEYKTKAGKLTLCYGDFKTLKHMGEQDKRFNDVFENTLKIVEGGYISDDFPFYYSWYNYKTQKYEKDEINAAEGMMTLLHLAEIGKLPNSTVQWLKDTITNKGIFGRYNVDGNVVEGYEYESTAVYAIAALIGKEMNDNELITSALSHMEKMRINNTKSQFNGAFGNEDGTGIYSFDQCMALITYGRLEERADS